MSNIFSGLLVSKGMDDAANDRINGWGTFFKDAWKSLTCQSDKYPNFIFFLMDAANQAINSLIFLPQTVWDLLSGLFSFDPYTVGYSLGTTFFMIFEIILAKAIAEGLTALAEKLGKINDKITGAEVAESVDLFSGLNAPKIFTNSKGQLTNGTYILDSPAMAKHLTGSTTSGKSQFLFNVDANKAVLDACAYADKYSLWNAKNQAKVQVLNGNIGVNGYTGELTNWIEITRTNTGFVHGWPCLP